MEEKIPEEARDEWEDYKTTGDKQLRDNLIEKYIPLVKHIAYKLLRSLKYVDFEDLVSDGIFGLMKAIDQFDPKRGVKFETYATPVIRGAILNGLRSMDWVPERRRSKTRELHRAMDKLATLYGREGTEEELAEELKISATEVYDLIANLGTVYLLSLNQPVSSGTEDEKTIIDTIEDLKSNEPSLTVEFAEQRQLLKEAIKDLPYREQVLVNLYYFEGVSFEDISKKLKVSKQRISQLHAKAIRKLREVLASEGTIL